MDGKAAKSIEAILEAYDKQQQIARREMERRRAEREAFLESFAAKVRTMIRPVMEQTGALMERAGHEFEITEHYEGKQLDGTVTNAAIRLRIFPNGERPRANDTGQIGWPHVAMIVSPSRNTILAHESAMMPNVGGPFGTAAEYLLEDVTEDVVNQHIINVLSRAMGIGRAKKPVKIKVKRHHSEPEVRRMDTGDERIDAAFNYLAQ